VCSEDNTPFQKVELFAFSGIKINTRPLSLVRSLLPLAHLLPEIGPLLQTCSVTSRAY